MQTFRWDKCSVHLGVCHIAQGLKRIPGTSATNHHVLPEPYSLCYWGPGSWNGPVRSLNLRPWRSRHQKCVIFVSLFEKLSKAPSGLWLGLLTSAHVYVTYTACYQCNSVGVTLAHTTLTSAQVLMASSCSGRWWSQPSPLTPCNMIHLDGDWLHIQFVSTPDQRLIIWNAWDVCAWEAWSAGACAGVAGKVINKGLSLAV